MQKVATPGKHTCEEVSEFLGRAETQALTPDEKDQLIIKTAGVMLNPPSATWEVQGRYGIHRRADVGLRYASGALRGDGRFTFLKPSAEGDLAGGVLTDARLQDLADDAQVHRVERTVNTL